eukprot:SAG31_NODE_622_length_13493_cov_7.301254_9_plen_70_part_00
MFHTKFSMFLATAVATKISNSTGTAVPVLKFTAVVRVLVLQVLNLDLNLVIYSGNNFILQASYISTQVP